MRDRDAVRWIDEAVDDLLAVQKLVHRGARKKFHEYDSTGLPSSVGGPSGKGGHSDRTQSEALKLASRLRSGFLAQLGEADLATVAVHRNARLLRSAYEAVALTTQEAPEGGCELCENCRQGDRQHDHRFTAVYSRRAPHDVSVAKVARCRFHYEFAEKYGEDAALPVTWWYLDHRSHVPHSLIRDHHPEAFARYQKARRAGDETP